MKKAALLFLLLAVAPSCIFSVSLGAERWALIEDVHGDRLRLETVSDKVWARLVQLYQNRSERWICGIVERYENEWGFRFDPKTIIVAEVTIEVWQTTIRGISENLDYWLGETAVVGARVVEVHQSPPVGGIWVAPNKLELLAPWIELNAVIVLSLIATVVFVKLRKKKQRIFHFFFTMPICNIKLPPKQTIKEPVKCM